MYDRFGRLMHGSEVVGKDVLEYVVFEKHIANTYGTWRIHDKIVPSKTVHAAGVIWFILISSIPYTGVMFVILAICSILISTGKRHLINLHPYGLDYSSSVLFGVVSSEISCNITIMEAT